MKIFEEYREPYISTKKVISAIYKVNLILQVHFNDGTESIVDFRPFLTKSKHPAIRKYLNEEFFTQFQIVDGNLNWNDYDLIFPVWDLYNGKI